MIDSTYNDSGFCLNDVSAPLKDTVETLYYSFRELRTHFGIRKTNASIFAIIQQYPCPVRCIDELKKPYEDVYVDKLYTAKEQKAKRILIDEIHSKFGSSVKLEEGYKISSGTLDLAIILQQKGKTIGIEIKNGSSEWTYVKMLDEIERYLIHTYLLLVIRIPYKSVDPIVRDDESLIQRIEWITKKANGLISEQLSCHECQWCIDRQQLSANKHEQSQKPSPIAKIDMSFYTNTVEVVKTRISSRKTTIVFFFFLVFCLALQ
jgi:hypothetical protein